MRSSRGFLALAMLGSLAVYPARADVTPQFAYATMSDGVKIALAVSFPPSFDPADGTTKWPALFTMHGYNSSIHPPAQLGRYVYVMASLRGRGCSGGQFDPFGRRPALDGYEIIENWIVKQPWSNQRVGIVGGSWPGNVGFQVASTNPPHLVASAVQGLISDSYRGIVYPGGILNRGFPVSWVTGRYTEGSEQEALNTRGLNEAEAGDPTCAANIATRPPPSPFLAQAAVERWDDAFWREHSLITWAANVAKPIHIAQQYQDHETGPSGSLLFERIPEGVPKRLVLNNGNHDSTIAQSDAMAWLDCWMLLDGKGCPGDLTDPDARVQVHFETTGQSGSLVANPPLVSSDFPLPETQWTRDYLRANGTLSSGQPAPGEAPTAFQTMSLSQSATLARSEEPPSAVYRLSFDQATAIAGPVAVDLWAMLDQPDADFFVEVIDEWPDGRWEDLQRGMLRASLRTVDEARSDRIAFGPRRGEVFRPYHPYSAPGEVIIPGVPHEYSIEVFPVGHVFRAGHRLVLRLSSPPQIDPVGGTYQYVSDRPPTVVTVLQDETHPSSVLVPVLPVLPDISPTAPECGAQAGIFCVKPSEPVSPVRAAPTPSPPDPKEPDLDGGLLASGVAGFVDDARTTTSLLTLAVSPGLGTNVPTGSFFFSNRVNMWHPEALAELTATGLWIDRVEKSGSTVTIEGPCLRNGEVGHTCVVSVTDTGAGPVVGEEPAPGTGDRVSVRIDDSFAIQGTVWYGDIVVA